MVDEIVMALLLLVTVALGVSFLRLAPDLLDTLLHSVSGESRSLMAVGLMRSGRRLRRTIELQTVMSRLVLITRLNLPLCPAIELGAVGESRRVRRTLEDLGRRLRGGTRLSEGLPQAFKGCPPPLAAALQGAEACGQLPQALADQERMIAAAIEEHVRTTAHVRHAVGYAAAMILFCGIMVLWTMIFLLPKLREIFRDFDAPLPSTTVALMNVGDWFAAHGIELVAGLLLLIFGAILMSFLATRVSEQSAFARFIAQVRWILPVTRNIDFGLGLSRAIRSMALQIRSGAPMSFVETLPLVVNPTNHLRLRLSKFAKAVSRGDALHQAAMGAELGDVFVGALRMVERGEDAQRALDHAAEYHEAVAFRWWHALTALSGPLVTLALGIMVGFVALALFLPLITLINAVSETL